MRRNFRRGPRSFRRRRPVSWWIPRTTETFPTLSAWADEGTVLVPGGGPTGGATFQIINNLRQGLAPVTGDDASLFARPLPAGHRVEAIRGEILLAMIEPQSNPNGLVGVRVDMGVFVGPSLGDVEIDYDPAPNDSTLEDWMWRKTVFLSSVVFGSFNEGGGPTTGSFAGNLTDSDSSSSDAIAGNFSFTTFGITTMSSAQAFGVPTSMVVPVRIKTKRRMHPEKHLSLIVRYVVPPGSEALAGNLSVTPRLRAVVSRPA